MAEQTRLDELTTELDKLQGELLEINLKLVDTLPMREFTHLRMRKQTLALRIHAITTERRELKKGQKETMERAFMTTVIEMFSPDDISEVWDRVYVNYPHLRRG